VNIFVRVCTNSVYFLFIKPTKVLWKKYKNIKIIVKTTQSRYKSTLKMDIGFYLSMAKEVGFIFQGENALKN